MQIAKEQYYVICRNFKFQKLYCIWVSDEVDYLVTDESRRITVFKSREGLINYAEKYSKCILDEVTIYDVQDFQKWLITPDSGFDCELFLNLWNLFTDVSESINQAFIGDIKHNIRNVIYDKLFDGGGPSFMASGIRPEFSDFEISELSKILKQGFDLLLNNTSIQE